MNREIREAAETADAVRELVRVAEPGIRRLDKGLADKVKKMGEAAGEVTKHIIERAGPTTG